MEPLLPESNHIPALSTDSSSQQPPRLIGPCYQPLSSSERFRLFVKRSAPRFSLAGVAFDAAYSQLTNDWPAYGQGADGYGKRFGATFADAEARTFIKTFLLPALLHQDPRYFRSSNFGVLPRAIYAATRVVITRNDRGRTTVNISELLGTVITKSFSNAYYPVPERGVGQTANRIAGGLLSSALSNLQREFWPDIRRKLRQHEPERIKRLQGRFEQRTQTSVGDLLAP